MEQNKGDCVLQDDKGVKCAWCFELQFFCLTSLCRGKGYSASWMQSKVPRAVGTGSPVPELGLVVHAI